MLTIDGIRAMGQFLLESLKAEKVVRFRRLCERLRTDERLVGAAVQSVLDKGSGHIDLEYAAWQLKDLGVVRIRYTGESLLDADLFPEIPEDVLADWQKRRPDFLIELTEKGERVLAEGLNFRFRDPGYRIQAGPASQRLIGVLDARRGATLTLREVMERGQFDGQIVIHDDCGNQYGLGTDSYAWAFEVSLWHHARAGNVLPACRNAEEEKVWSDFVSRTERPPLTDASAPQPLWDIPFRLADEAIAGEVPIDHVDTLET
jgi:hypothetical protein